MASGSGKPRVYLCGPITGTTYEECALGWRKDVWDALSPLGIECYSPMRGKQNIIEAGQRYGSLSKDYAGAISRTQAILGRDRADTQRADLLFCNLLGAKITSIGSMIEFGWADSARVPILLCMEPFNDNKELRNIHEHLFVRGLVTYDVETIQEGIEIAKHFLLAGLM